MGARKVRMYRWFILAVLVVGLFSLIGGMRRYLNRMEQLKRAEQLRVLPARFLRYTKDMERLNQLTAKIDAIFEQAIKVADFGSEINEQFERPLIYDPFRPMHRNTNTVGIYWITVPTGLSLESIDKIVHLPPGRVSWPAILGELRRTRDRDEPLVFSFADDSGGRNIWPLAAEDRLTKELMKQVKNTSGCLVLAGEVYCYPFRMEPAPTSFLDFDPTSIRSVALFDAKYGSEKMSGYNALADVNSGEIVGTARWPDGIIVDRHGDPIVGTNRQPFRAQGPHAGMVCSVTVCVLNVPQYRVVACKTFEGPLSDKPGESEGSAYGQALFWLHGNKWDEDVSVYRVEPDYTVAGKQYPPALGQEAFYRFVASDITDNIVVAGD